MTTPLAISKIYQKDNWTFCILWNDQTEQSFRLSDLQKNCPCANCREEQAETRTADPRMVKEDVRAVVVRSVGRYGLQIQFTSGCSMGIYSFDFLRQVGKT